jgi:hypothetical protein
VVDENLHDQLSLAECRSRLVYLSALAYRAEIERPERLAGRGPCLQPCLEVSDGRWLVVHEEMLDAAQPRFWGYRGTCKQPFHRVLTHPERRSAVRSSRDHVQLVSVVGIDDPDAPVPRVAAHALSVVAAAGVPHHPLQRGCTRLAYETHRIRMHL